MMKKSGARGMRERTVAGAYTLAQDEATSVIFGMPKEAIQLGGVARVLPLGAIAGAVLEGTRD
jgi:two-component system, chemotaxis family, protein-glutamate methylesterase/glutaminase